MALCLPVLGGILRSCGFRHGAHEWSVHRYNCRSYRSDGRQDSREASKASAHWSVCATRIGFYSNRGLGLTDAFRNCCDFTLCFESDLRCHLGRRVERRGGGVRGERLRHRQGVHDRFQPKLGNANSTIGYRCFGAFAMIGSQGGSPPPKQGDERVENYKASLPVAHSSSGAPISFSCRTSRSSRSGSAPLPPRRSNTGSPEAALVRTGASAIGPQTKLPLGRGQSVSALLRQFRSTCSAIEANFARLPTGADPRGWSAGTQSDGKGRYYSLRGVDGDS